MFKMDYENSSAVCSVFLCTQLVCVSSVFISCVR
jgi:hypothetical protein